MRWLVDETPSKDIIEAIAELRLAVEPAGAGLAARRAPVSDGSAIAEAYRQLQQASGPTNLNEARLRLHMAVMSGSGNPLFLQFNSAIELALATAMRPLDAEELGRCYGPLIAAISAHDEGAAYRVMADLVRRDGSVAEPVASGSNP